MAKKHTLSAGFALVLITMGGLISAFQTLFAGWMTSYPHTYEPEWRIRFYVELAVTLVLGVCWLVDAAWLVREDLKCAERR
jgi:hypothetical protein